MSRVGRLPVKVPKDVKVQIRGQSVKVTSKKGELEQAFPPEIQIALENDEIVCKRADETHRVVALHGLTRAMINNMVTGLTKGFTKELDFVGVGYRASVSGRTLTLNVGYSHPVEMAIPEGLDVKELDKKGTSIVISGVDRQAVGEFAAKVRRIRPPEVYKGKGIRYKTEHVKTKAGKKVGA